jgi:hypothetical protein
MLIYLVQFLTKNKIRPATCLYVLTNNQIGAIFGDLDELLAVRKQEIQRHAITFVKSTGNRLEDEFEPLILSMKHISPQGVGLHVVLVAATV